MQDINWLKKGMKRLLLLTLKQPHLSFQQTPHLFCYQSKSASLLYLLTLWQTGDLIDLLRDGKIIQSKLASAKRRSPEDIAQIFSKLMLQGKISAALKFLKFSQNDILPSSPEVIIC